MVDGRILDHVESHEIPLEEEALVESVTDH